MTTIVALAVGSVSAMASAQSTPAAPPAVPPAPYVPLLGPVPLATTPLGRGLAGAANAIDATRASDPAAAARAQALYMRARQQAASGDVSGALATSALARAAALAGSAPGGGLQPAVPSVHLGAPLGIPNVPLAGGGSLLPDDLLLARAEIERVAAKRHGSALDLAKADYRRALDAWLSGDAARARRFARAASAVAAFAETKGP